GAGVAADHRRRIRGPRGAADAGAVWPAHACRARAVCAGRAGRSIDLDGQPAVLCGFTTGDRPRARRSRLVARLWACSLGTYARADYGPADRRDDDGRSAVL